MHVPQVWGQRCASQFWVAATLPFITRKPSSRPRILYMPVPRVSRMICLQSSSKFLQNYKPTGIHRGCIQHVQGIVIKRMKSAASRACSRLYLHVQDMKCVCSRRSLLGIQSTKAHPALPSRGHVMSRPMGSSESQKALFMS